MVPVWQRIKTRLRIWITQRSWHFRETEAQLARAQERLRQAEGLRTELERAKARAQAAEQKSSELRAALTDAESRLTAMAADLASFREQAAALRVQLTNAEIRLHERSLLDAPAPSAPARCAGPNNRADAENPDGGADRIPGPAGSQGLVPEPDSPAEPQSLRRAPSGLLHRTTEPSEGLSGDADAVTAPGPVAGGTLWTARAEDRAGQRPGT